MSSLRCRFAGGALSDIKFLKDGECMDSGSLIVFMLTQIYTSPVIRAASFALHCGTGTTWSIKNATKIFIDSQK